MSPRRRDVGRDGAGLAARNRRVFVGHGVFSCVAGTGLDAQKKSWRFSERDEASRAEAARAAWVKELEAVPARDRVYVDESGCDNRLAREHDWSLRGEPCFDTRVGHATQRLSVVAAWQPQPQSQSQSGLMAALSFAGTCHSRLFELWLHVMWLHVMLCPELRPGQVVILDNARFHRKSAVQRILKKVGCRALFLPPYSPDLNPIEHQWHRLKARVRNLRQHGLEFKQALEAALV